MSGHRRVSLLTVLVGVIAGLVALALIVSFVALRHDERPVAAQTSPVSTAPVSTATPAAPGADQRPSRPTVSPKLTEQDRTGPAARQVSGQPEVTSTAMTATDSRLYNVMFAANSGRCAGLTVRAPALPDAELVAYLQQISDCLVELNAAELAEQQITLTPPKVAGFLVQAQTACGTHSRHAFYCPEDQTIYVDLRSDEGPVFYGNDHFGYLTLISHEFGHHLQLVGGVTRDYAARLDRADPRQREELSRRFELQATCFSGVFYGLMWHSLDGSEATYHEIGSYFDHHNDHITGEGTHGTGVAMRHWFAAGFNHDWNAYGRCNTWTAEPRMVH